MRQSLHFVVVLVIGLFGITVVGYAVLVRTTRNWFVSDVAMRSRVAVSGARQSLIQLFTNEDREGLERLLKDISHDERIMAAAVCTEAGVLLAKTDDYPNSFSCRRIKKKAMSGDRSRLPFFWATLDELPGGQVHVSAVGLRNSGRDLGFVVLVHDMSYVGRREARTRDFLLVAFVVLAVLASIFTLIAARLSWRGWTRSLRLALQGRERHPEYQPLLREVRELVGRLSGERALEHSWGNWTPERLKAVLAEHLQDEQIVVVANREPYIHNREPDGSVSVVRPASGLVTALEPVMRACSGVWVAHGGGSADRDTADSRGRVRVPPGEESYVLRRVWLTEAEEQGYYYGFSNEGLWPLCHLAHTRPVFRAEDWECYREVNAKFAKAICDEVAADDPVVLVQDYHFALLPQMIRERLPRATILTFWHIPWPNSEYFGICPFRQQLLEGLLGSSIMGFHTQQHCNNFLDAVDAFLEARIDREQHAVVHHARKTLVRPYPISIEWPTRRAHSVPSVNECRANVFAQLGLKPNALLGVGVDRLDYTKGIEERLLAVERMLERFPEFCGRFTFVQLAAPSRTRIGKYRDLNEIVEQVASRINERFGEGDYRPIVMLRAHHEAKTVFQYYRAADLCYVSSLHDGMNLVAKEFVASRDDEQGVLILSHFTGAARELTEALIVNPYNLEQASSALAAALRMSADEKRERMRAMRTMVSEFNVYRWAGRMLLDAAQLRQRERLSGRFSRSSAEPLTMRA